MNVDGKQCRHRPGRIGGRVKGTSSTVSPLRAPSRGRPRAGGSPWTGRALICAFLLFALRDGVPRVFAFPGGPVPEVPFPLRPEVQVDSGGIYLHQVLSVPLSALPPRPIRLAAAPGLGQASTLSRAQLSAILARTAPDLAITNWAGAESVRVTRRTRLLQDDELRQLLAGTLQRDQVKDRGDLELRTSRPWTAVLVPDEPLQLTVLDLPATGVSANFIVRFELRAGPERFGPWQLILQARVMKDVLVARNAVRRGQSLQEAEFAVEKRDVLALREPLDEAVLKNPTLEIVEALTPGQVLLARSVRLRPVVLRGQMVDGLVRDGALQINMRVEVLADGLPGQLVRVRNPRTKREFYAKVQDEQTVLINL